MQGKLLLQEAVRLKIGWNEALSPEWCQKWKKWVINLKYVGNITFSRYLIKPNFTDASFELHCFNDASQQAYGSCIYIRCTSKSGRIHTALVASKVCVCPLKVQTIPRPLCSPLSYQRDWYIKKSVSDDPKDDVPLTLGKQQHVPLTPANFLMIEDEPILSPGRFSPADMCRGHWIYIQYLLDVFWRRYVNQHLPELQRRQRWQCSKRQSVELSQQTETAVKIVSKPPWNAEFHICRRSLCHSPVSILHRGRRYYRRCTGGNHTILQI